MLPSPSHPQAHHLPSTSNMHYPPRQSKLLDTRAYSHPQSQAPTPSRIRTQQTATKRSVMGGLAPNRAAHRQSNNNSSTVGSNTPTCANCATQTTPLWRRNQSGETLCNACALFQKMKGRPRPISLKTNVIKPRNRIKAIDRIPLGLSSSHNQQHSLLVARSNSNPVNLTHQQAPHVLAYASEKNQSYPPNSRSINSPATVTPSLLCHSLYPNPIPPHICPSALSSPNQFHSEIPKNHFLDTYCLSPSPNNSINPSSSQSPSPSQNSFCSTRSTPQVQSHTTQLVRSRVSSRKSSPGGVEPLNNQDLHTFTQEAKRRKYLSDDVLNRTPLYERRISTGSIEPLHQHPHLPLRASSHARITPTTPVYPELCDHGIGPSGKLSDPSRHYYASVDDHVRTRSPQLVSTLSSGQQTPVCSVVFEHEEKKQLTHSLSRSLNRGRSTLKSPGINLPPLSQITKDLVPALQHKPNPINLGPPLSFEASALQARLNSPNSSQSQHLLTIPSSTHQKLFEKRRAGSVISSASDSESVLSPGHTGSTSSRIHSPLGRSHFPCNTGSPTTPSFNGEGLMCKLYNDPKVFNQYQSSRDKLTYDLGSQPEIDHQDAHLSKLHVDHPSEENKPQTQELNRLKDRIVQLELINGAMEDRISELEHTQPDRTSKGTFSEASDERTSLRSTSDERRSSFQTIDDEHSPSDHGPWAEEIWLEDERVEKVDGGDGEEQQDAISSMSDDGHV